MPLRPRALHLHRLIATAPAVASALLLAALALAACSGARRSDALSMGACAVGPALAGAAALAGDAALFGGHEVRDRWFPRLPASAVAVDVAAGQPVALAVETLRATRDAREVAGGLVGPAGQVLRLADLGDGRLAPGRWHLLVTTSGAAVRVTAAGAPVAPVPLGDALRRLPDRARG